MYGIDELGEITDGYIIMGRILRHCGEWCHIGNSIPFILEIDENGSPVWNTSYEFFNIDYWSENYNRLADLLTGGKVSGIITQDQGYLLGNDNWAFKINQEGVKEWNQTYNGQIFAICQINDEGIILAGCETTTQINGGLSRDIWIAKTNGLGYLLWEKTIRFKQKDNNLFLEIKKKENSKDTHSNAIAFIPTVHNLYFMGIIVYIIKNKRRKKEFKNNKRTTRES